MIEWSSLTGHLTRHTCFLLTILFHTCCFLAINPFLSVRWIVHRLLSQLSFAWTDKMTQNNNSSHVSTAPLLKRAPCLDCSLSASWLSITTKNMKADGVVHFYSTRSIPEDLVGATIPTQIHTWHHVDWQKNK